MDMNWCICGKHTDGNLYCSKACRIADMCSPSSSKNPNPLFVFDDDDDDDDDGYDTVSTSSSPSLSLSSEDESELQTTTVLKGRSSTTTATAANLARKSIETIQRKGLPFRQELYVEKMRNSKYC